MGLIIVNNNTACSWISRGLVQSENKQKIQFALFIIFSVRGLGY